MSDASLLPPNATRYERALTEETARVSQVPTPLRDLWNPDTCPTELLPWLAWTLGVSAWKPYWSDAVKREQIRQAVEVHRHRGTVQAVRRVVTSFGAALSLREWWESSPVGAPHSFAITLNVNDSSNRSADLQQDIIDEITRVKPARSYFTLTLGINANGVMGLQGVSRFAVYRRLDMFEGPFAWRGEVGFQGASRPANYVRLSAAEISSPIDRLLSMLANGEAGACYIPRPVMLGKQVLFQDQWGRDPVTADGDPVGLMMDLSRRQKRGPELISDPGFDSASAWVYSAGWNVANGVATADGNQASSSSMPKITYDLVQGRMYEVQLEVLSISAGVAQVVVGNHGTIINVAEPGIYKALFVANSTATRTLFFGGRTDFVGSVDNASLKEVYGAHAIQSVSASRPTYRTDGTHHWLEFDGVDDHLSVPGTASTWTFLHDGSDAYASLGMGLTTEDPYQQLAGTADRSVTTSIGMTIGRYASGERYRTTLHNGPPLGSIAADLNASGYPSAPVVNSTLIDGNQAHLRLDGKVVASAAITSPSTEVATYDFTIGGDGGGASYATLTFYGAVIHEGSMGIADTESYLQGLLVPGGTA
uniref:phage tail protein I n=1 Tax=Halomonas sp. TaxID=1486246 RepID=UPI0026102E11|nr:phage tail protein I [Halomonas sp.]